VAVVALGSTCGTAKAAADQAREKGVKAGVLKLRTFRPFPGEEIAEVVRGVGTVAVMDRAISYGLRGGPLFNEIRSFAGGDSLQLINYVYGLGGRDINTRQIEDIFTELVKIKESGDPGNLYRYACLRE